MEVLEGNQIECSRCENIIELEDAVGLNKSKSIFKPLCSDCLGAIGVPQGYDLERDITYLAR
ncbi:hypothetical protein halTADL_1396 [Halohasta litchfieldiae]|jgi:hypothetical protein|uniref:Small CPxCG-related zinc finger protein n=1 Tax=Halohasta litchfieldiae TaxID=1073996 RepID=A0A1H6W7P1_9EURY|nr:hypothetical protein halTADL_1396 [Halohasta litchfieldiae]SEJ10077.1 hypothetical protein SAMN05444271_12119 [Halohasta litchfieldiae]